MCSSFLCSPFFRDGSKPFRNAGNFKFWEACLEFFRTENIVLPVAWQEFGCVTHLLIDQAEQSELPRLHNAVLW